MQFMTHLIYFLKEFKYHLKETLMNNFVSVDVNCEFFENVELMMSKWVTLGDIAFQGKVCFVFVVDLNYQYA